jgi:glycosyltransferase involved in cell wall biosynthesis
MNALKNNKRRNTVAIVTNSTWNVYNFRKELVAGLIEEGYRVVLLTPVDSTASLLKKEFSVEIYDLPLDKRGINPLKDLHYLWRLYRIMGKVRPDIVLNFVMKPLIYGSWVAHWLKIPVISTQTGLGTAYLRGGLLAKLSMKLYRSAYKGKVRKVLFHNKDDLEFFVSKGIVDVDQADTIPGSGIDLEKFVPDSFEKKEGQSLRVLFVARLIADKGIREFLDAVEILHKSGTIDIEFQVIGNTSNDTEENRKIKSRVEKMHEKGMIKFLGYRKDVPEWMKRADIVVMPSYREGTSRVLLEASALEKPIVTTDVPGCRNVVLDGESGLLAKVADAKDLAEKIDTLLKMDEEQRRTMGRRGREYVSEVFDVHRVVERYTEMIRSELGKE